jgi:hypothetical protein
MKDFVSYELAVKLKTLGFNLPCYMYIYTGDTGNNYDHYLEVKPSDSKDWNGKSDLCVSRPTFSQAFRWFREEYDLRIWIESNHGVSKFEYVIATTNHNFIDKQFNDFSSYKTYEEAELACLEKLIEIVEQIKSE